MHGDFNKEHPLRSMSIAIIGACNLNCAFCYVGGTREGKMDFETFKKIVDDAIPLGLRMVKITGGEPTLHPELHKFLDYLHQHGIQNNIVTNGTMITEQSAKKFRKSFTTVKVSLESIDEKTDDSLTRVPGTWKKKMQAIEILRRNGFNKKNLCIIIKALKQNKKYFLQTYEWAYKNNITPALDRLIPVMNAKEEWAITGPELNDLISDANKIEEFNLETQMPQTKNSPCNVHGRNCYIEVNGDVYPCSGLRVIAGNIFRHSLDEIWNDSAVFKEFFAFRDDLKGTCGKCEQSRLNHCCGCRAIAFAIFHDPRAPDPHCPRYNPNDKWVPDYSYWKNENFSNISKPTIKI